MQPLSVGRRWVDNEGLAVSPIRMRLRPHRHNARTGYALHPPEKSMGCRGRLPQSGPFQERDSQALPSTAPIGFHRAWLSSATRRASRTRARPQPCVVILTRALRRLLRPVRPGARLIAAAAGDLARTRSELIADMTTRQPRRYASPAERAGTWMGRVAIKGLQSLPRVRRSVSTLRCYSQPVLRCLTITRGVGAKDISPRNCSEGHGKEKIRGRGEGGRKTTSSRWSTLSVALSLEGQGMFR